MARMSIDDSFGRDPRVRVLAKKCGWSRRETMGALLDIFAVCYDRVTALLPEQHIITTAEQDGLECPGFVEKLIESGLASRHKNSSMIRIAGAEERILYLIQKSESGRVGGLKSAESRKKQPKQTSSTPQAVLPLTLKHPGSTPQAPRNPPVPDLVPDLDPASVPDPVPSLALVPDRGAREPNPEIGRLVTLLFPLHLEAFNRLRSELKANCPRMGVVGDAAERALRDLLVEQSSLIDFEERARHALRVREAQARSTRSLKFFGMSVWNRVAFDRAQSMSTDDYTGDEESNLVGLEEAYRTHKALETT